jgi:hypothetical protein
VHPRLDDRGDPVEHLLLVGAEHVLDALRGARRLQREHEALRLVRVVERAREHEADLLAPVPRRVGEAAVRRAALYVVRGDAQAARDPGQVRGEHVAVVEARLHRHREPPMGRPAHPLEQLGHGADRSLERAHRVAAGPALRPQVAVGLRQRHVRPRLDPREQLVHRPLALHLDRPQRLRLEHRRHVEVVRHALHVRHLGRRPHAHPEAVGPAGDPPHVLRPVGRHAVHQNVRLPRHVPVERVQVHSSSTHERFFFSCVGLPFFFLGGGGATFGVKFLLKRLLLLLLLLLCLGVPSSFSILSFFC